MLDPSPIYFGDVGTRLFGWLHRPGRTTRDAPRSSCVIRSATTTSARIVHCVTSPRICAPRASPCCASTSTALATPPATERDPGRVAAWRRDVGARDRRAPRRRPARPRSRSSGCGSARRSRPTSRQPARRRRVGRAVASVLDGKSFDERDAADAQVASHARARELRRGPARATPTAIEALGFFLTTETVAAVEEPRPARARAPPGAARARDRAPAMHVERGPLLERLRALGRRVDYRHLPGHKFLISIPHHRSARRPSAHAGWHRRRSHAARASRVRDRSRRRGAGQAGPEREAATRAAGVSSRSRSCSGRPIGFGIRPGCSCQRRAPRQSRAPAIAPRPVIDDERRDGAPDRSAPVLRRAGARARGARLLCAAHGPRRHRRQRRRQRAPRTSAIRRPAWPTCQDGDDRAGDAPGVTRFIIAGLCSGGDIAFQLGIAGSRAIAGIVMMNPRTFLRARPRARSRPSKGAHTTRTRSSRRTTGGSC